MAWTDAARLASAQARAAKGKGGKIPRGSKVKKPKGIRKAPARVTFTTLAKWSEASRRASGGAWVTGPHTRAKQVASARRSAAGYRK